MEDSERLPKGVVHSTRVKAGKRTYFIDVRQTRQNDHYITLTESTKKTDGNKSFYIRNKVLVYKEDFQKLLEGLQNTISLIEEELEPAANSKQEEGFENDERLDLDFESLGQDSNN